MNHQQASFTVNGAVMTVTIDNPETKNGLDWIGINQFADCYEYANAHPEIKVMVVTGNERYFYTGGRVDAKNPGEKEKYADAIERLTTLQDNCTTPLVAAVSGDCMKAGMGLLATSDFAVACDDVTFCFPETRMGGAPMMVMAETINCMSPKRGLEAYLTSWEYTAQQAYAMGYLNAVVPRGEFDATVQKYVDVLLNTPETIVRQVRSAYSRMAAVNTLKERRSIAMQMLREDVLVSMVNAKTSYNV